MEFVIGIVVIYFLYKLVSGKPKGSSTIGSTVSKPITPDTQSSYSTSSRTTTISSSNDNDDLATFTLPPERDLDLIVEQLRDAPETEQIAEQAVNVLDSDEPSAFEQIALKTRTPAGRGL